MQNKFEDYLKLNFEKYYKEIQKYSYFKLENKSLIMKPISPQIKQINFKYKRIIYIIFKLNSYMII